jgi:hypothetical protein
VIYSTAPSPANETRGLAPDVSSSEDAEASDAALVKENDFELR